MQTRGVKVRAYPDFLLGPLTWENYVGSYERWILQLRNYHCTIRPVKKSRARSTNEAFHGRISIFSQGCNLEGGEILFQRFYIQYSEIITWHSITGWN